MHKNTILIIIFLFFSVRLLAQNDGLSDVVRNLELHVEKHLPEKVYVQTDKPFYVAGEIIWLKVLTTDGIMNKLLDLSKIAYVELLNGDQKPVLQGKIALEGGKGTGTFSIPVSLSSGIYRLRAYTNWMKNDDPEFYFEKPVRIINALKKVNVSNVSLVQNYDIQFFPEGGNLVSGIESTVGFRVVDKDGKGLDFSGSIVDLKDSVVTNFAPLIFGIGRFSFTPTSGSQYKAILKLGTNQVVVANFPKVFEKGWVMHTHALSDSGLEVDVHSNLQEEAPVYCMVQNRHAVRSVQAANLVNGYAKFNISNKYIAEGISQITLFNSLKQPVCERLFFKAPDSLQIKVQADQEAYPQRKKVTLYLQTEHQSQPPELCLSVYLADSLQGPDPVNILNYLWLQSDLKGSVESPSYYFNTSDKTVQLAADNLMITHGWRRYTWKDILELADTNVAFMPEHHGHLVNGKIVDRRTGSGIPNMSIFLSAPGQHYQFAATVSKADGQIQFDLKDFYGADGIVLQADRKDDSLIRIDISNPYSNRFSANPIERYRFPKYFKDELLDHSIGSQVQNVYHAEELNIFHNPVRPDSSNFYGVPDGKYFLDDYTRFPTTEEVLREYISDILLRKQKDRFIFRVLNTPRKTFFSDYPLVLLDGVPVLDVTKIVNMDPLKIKKIEVVARQFYLGSYIASGIISVSTYKGDLDGFALDSGALVLDYDGCKLQREFFSPVYETAEQINSRLPDFRNTLCWKPSIQIDSLGKSRISFYTSDQTGKYIGCVQGLDRNGKAGVSYFNFEVQRRQR